MHSIFNVGAISFLQIGILSIMLALHYFTLLVMIIIYIRITLADPVDELIIN